MDQPLGDLDNGPLASGRREECRSEPSAPTHQRRQGDRTGDRYKQARVGHRVGGEVAEGGEIEEELFAAEARRTKAKRATTSARQSRSDSSLTERSMCSATLVIRLRCSRVGPSVFPRRYPIESPCSPLPLRLGS